MKKNLNKSISPKFLEVLKNAWQKTSKKNLELSNSRREQKSKIIAAIQELSYGETRKDIEEKLKELNKKWSQTSKNQY